MGQTCALCIISYVVNRIDTEKYSVFSDIHGHTAPGGGSLPSEICINAKKPDMVLVDKSKKSLHLFELTGRQYFQDTTQQKATNLIIL